MSVKIKKLISTESLIGAAVIFIAIFLAKFPTLYNWLNTPKGYWYPKSTTWYDAWDTNFQVSYIRYGQRKGLLLENTYTTTPHKPVLIYQYYTGLGVLNRFLQLDPFIIFHLASIITSTILLLVCFWVVKLFFKETLYRISAFLVIALGGGLAWIPNLSFSADNKIAGFTLVNALERGHDALTTLLLLLTFGFCYLFAKTSNAKYTFFALISAVVGMTFHPPMLGLYLLLGVVMAAIYFIEKRKIIFFAFPIILLLAFIIYGILVLLNLFSNPGFTGVVAQKLFDVDSLSILLGFGLLSAFAFWSIVINDKENREVFFLKIFFLLQLFAIFLPFGFHLYFAKGMFVWGVILGLFGLRNLITWEKMRMIVLTVVVFTSLLFRWQVFTTLMNANVNNYFFFLTRDEGDAISFISKLPKDSGILSLYRMGNHIPAHTDNIVYYGHKFQTPGASEKLKLAQAFYFSDDKELQREFLAKNNIQYIYYGLEEKKQRKDAKLDTKNPFPTYPIIFQNDTSIIYSVTASADKEKT